MWTTYWNSSKIRAKGEYKNDLRVGKWTFHNNKGEIIQEFDFDTNKMIFVDTAEVNPKFTIQGGKYDGLIHVDTIPSFKEGEKELFSFISKNIEYPQKAKEEKIMGAVYVSFIVDKKGELSDFEIKKGIGGGCDEETVRVLRMTNGDWNPASLNGENVTIRVTFPFRFISE